MVQQALIRGLTDKRMETRVRSRLQVSTSIDIKIEEFYMEFNIFFRNST